MTRYAKEKKKARGIIPRQIKKDFLFSIKFDIINAKRVRISSKNVLARSFEVGVRAQKMRK